MPNLKVDEQFMSQALEEARTAGNESNWAIGCVIVIDGEVVAREHNTGYTDGNRLAHAELKALVEARELLEQNKGKATLYTTYEPCPMCFGAIIMMKIGRVVTGIDLDNSGCLGMKEALPPFFQQEKFQFEVTRGVLAEECERVYKQSQVGKKHLGMI
jgi:tRNA(adenine34) deaminase